MEALDIRVVGSYLSINGVLYTKEEATDILEQLLTNVDEIKSFIDW